ncbi:hypothetical protein FJTKL_03280 [Diaporthe vaccinii]|uniref:Telomeric repeat-binding factor 2-interacting protein 1 n=1 Tax=Diaporthe vaccinii TaxID=105482 RepID=A0ABR4DVH8_9PEZI
MPIVYDGTRGSSHGDLFRGLKLFISLRVPQRERWANLVQGNGGEVVKLEKQADMLIADHIKKNGAAPPADSYSWQWIEYSVKNGFLQPKDDYRIEGVPAAGASAPAKGKQRVKFTKEDDEILARFVLNHERQGHATKGNVIFEDLYKKYNHHSAQSWRDRWIKYVSSRPRPNLPQEDPQPDAGMRGSPGHRPGSVGGPPQSQAGPSNVHSTPARSPVSTPKKQTTPQSRNKFTQEDDEILLRMVRERRDIAAAQGIREGLDGNKIFQDLEAKYPNRHPWGSWRNRWVRHLNVGASSEQDDLGMQDEEGRPEQQAERLKKQSGVSRDVSAPRTQAKSTTALSSAGVLPAQSTPQLPRPRSDDERLKRQEQSKRRARAAKLLQRTWRGHIVRRDRAQLESSIVPLQSLMRGYLLRMRKSERLLDALEANAEPVEDDQIEDAEQYEDAREDLNPEVDGNDSSFRDQFYEDLQDYLEVSGAEIEGHPVVDGREVELWDLFSVVTRQDCAVEDRNWKEVAQRLGFDWTSSAGCVKDLKECYDRNLAEFEEAIGSYDDQDDTARGEEEQVSHDDEGQELPQTSDAVTAPKEPSPARLSPPYRSSSPVAGVKRSFQQSTDPQSELNYPSDGSGKRQRRDRGKTIPQTPDHKLGLVGGTSSRAAAQDFSSPLKSRGAATGRDGLYSVEDADDFLNNGMHDIQEIDDLPDISPPRKKRFVEPETQDFGVVVGGDDIRRSIEENDIGYMTDEDDISPSQQLQSEFNAISSPAHPVPSRGNGTASASRPPFVEPKRRPPGRPAKGIHTSASGPATTNGSPKGGTAHNRTSTLKATKRSLPQQYQAQPAVSAATHTPASAPIRNGIAAQPTQLRSPIVARPTIVARAHSPDFAMRRPRQTVSATPTRPVQSSAQPRNLSRIPPTSSAPALDPARNKDKSPDPDFGEEYVDAQFEHFLALGYDTRHIGQAMEVASLQRGPMTVALQSLHAGKGLPQNAEGVWTDDDDVKLRRVRDYDRRQKSRASSSGSGENSREKALVERYRSFLLTKHQSWFAYRLAFMNLMDKETKETAA